MKRKLVYNIATFFLSKLYEYGRNVKKSDLSNWASRELSRFDPKMDSREYSFYKQAAFDLLSEENLLVFTKDEVSVGITEKGCDVFIKYQSIEKYIVNMKNKKRRNEQLDLAIKIISLISAICGATSTIIGFLLNTGGFIYLGNLFFGFVLGLCFNACKSFLMSLSLFTNKSK
ncbi:MAG: hypothetical protein KBT33_13325 [Prevotellaceae bacterium]|nr:hypothetical protein [Candidatus Minthosoma equi]